MLIRHLTVVNFRNIQHEKIDLSPGCNVFLGKNGAGKTAFLEAVDVLSRGKTFRTHYISPLIRYNQSSYAVEADLAQGQTVRIKKTAGQPTTAEINHKKINRRAEVAILLPVRVLHPDSHLLLQGGSKNQRAFLDWGVFHMKPSAGQHWVAYQQVLKQRNQLLKQRVSKTAMCQWDEMLVTCAGKLHEARKTHFEALQERLSEVDPDNDQVRKYEIRYRQGWPAGESLATALTESYPYDSHHGYTRVGPHRATMQFLLSGADAVKHASRGQQKMLIAYLLLAQTLLFSEQTGKQCLLLIDDLSAELDGENQRRLIRLIQSYQIQSMISMTEDTLSLEQQPDNQVFHVKQGQTHR